METLTTAAGVDVGRLRQLFKAMADDTRLRILHLLTRQEELCVCEIMRALEMPQSTISRHMAYLKNSGWVNDRREAVWVHYSLAEPTNCVHESLLECIKGCFGRFPSFEEDERRLAGLVGEGECVR